MVGKLLLLSENVHHGTLLESLLRKLQYEVITAPVANLEHQLIPSCAMAVVEVGMQRLAHTVAVISGRRIVSKILVLIPFDTGGAEMRAVELGADDVLTMPVSRPRLEVTLHNLLRLHLLERAAKAAYGDYAA